MSKINLSLCPSPDLYSVYKNTEKTLVIVVDILRATSSMVTAFGNGAKAILAVDSTEKCENIGKSNGYLMAAERNVKRCSFADLGNDPSEYTEAIVKNQTIVMTTTNGTRSLSIARENPNNDIIIGAFLNIRATAQYIIKNNYTNIIVIAAGWKGQVSLEDCLYSGALSSELSSMTKDISLNDMAFVMDMLYKEKAKDIDSRCKLIEGSEHYNRLVASSLGKSCKYCLTENIFNFVVALSSDGLLRIVKEDKN